jgi:uncharacterized protein YegL
MAARSVYLLADTSGSTARGGFADGWRRAQPRLVAAAERGGHRICFLSYADDATLRVPLMPARDLVFIPEMRASGLSSLAAGLRLLAGVADQDRRQLETDGIPAGPAVAVVVADGLPTDRDERLLAARDTLAGDTELHLAVPPGEDRLALAALRAVLHPIPAAGAEEVAEALIAAVEAAVAMSPAARGDTPAAAAALAESPAARGVTPAAAAASAESPAARRDAPAASAGGPQ